MVLGDEAGIDNGGQRDVPGGIAAGGAVSRRRGDGQPRLADPAGAAQGKQAQIRPLQQAREGGEFGIAPDERGQRGGEIAGQLGHVVIDGNERGGGWRRVVARVAGGGRGHRWSLGVSIRPSAEPIVMGSWGE